MNMKIKFFRTGKFVNLVLTVLFLLPIISSAGSLDGKITDQTDGSGLVHAIITIIPNNSELSIRSAAADADGKFIFSNIDAGGYTIKVTYVGFSTWQKRNVSFDGDENKTLNVELVPSTINLNAISVSASRRPEKIVDAPAAVSLVESADIVERATLTPTEHVKGLPGVDVASTGLSQSNVVVRGFNNIFSGALLVLTDNRIARVPSLRFNAYNFIPTINSDIERIEIVSGPGSALYGPNSSNGVMHIITKSPFTSQGTTFSIGGGERDVAIGSFRHAGMFSDDIAFKISGQYYQGNDWEHYEPETFEPSHIALFRSNPVKNDTVKATFLNTRDFDIEKISGEGRVDFLLGDNTSLVLNSGFNRASSIELTGLGAGQAIDWTYGYGQVRLNYKDFFIQGFVNASDAGDTYLLNTGQLIEDKSKLWVLQVQHRYQPNEQTSLTYGVDGLFTRPNTEGTINGRNENQDNINEFGVYIQGDYKFSDKLKFVGAFRADDNDQLEDMVYSPRAGLVFQPDANNNFRFTYNRAFTTPDNNNLFLDILQGRNQFFDIRVQGVPESGFHWSFNGEDPQFRSQFAPLAGLSTGDYINLNDPLFTNVMWSVGRSAVMAGTRDHLVDSVGLDPIFVDSTVMPALNRMTAGTVNSVNNNLMTLSMDDGQFHPSTSSDVKNIDRMKPTITQTFEVGYKGIIDNKLQFSFDAYRTQKDNFVGPLTIETPNVFLDPTTLGADIYSQFTDSFGVAGNAADAGLLNAVFDTTGDNAADELAGMFTIGAAQIPYGVVGAEEQLDPDAVLITYRNFGEVTYYGADLAFAYHINHKWNIGGMYSYVSKNFFEKNDTQVHDIYLNAPKNKFGAFLKYSDAKRKLNAQARYRWVQGFEMASPFFGSEVETYGILDFNFGIDLIERTHLSLTIQNVLDNKHAEFVGAAEIGRLAIMRVTQNF